MTVRLESGDLVVGVLPDRGLDLGIATFRGERFSWTSPLGHVPRRGDFHRSFGGELMFTCGLPELAPGAERAPSLEIHVEAA